MPPKHQMGNTQLACLKDVCLNKTLLVVLDDCWTLEHFEQFNILAPETASKMLISTRITGLIKGVEEVKLELMTTEESVDLLAHGSGLDVAETPPSLIEVSRRVD